MTGVNAGEHGGGYGRGIALMLASATTWVAMNAFVKEMSAIFPPTEILFFRNIVAVPVMVVIAASTGGLRMLATRRPGWHLLRSAIGIAGMITLIYGLSRAPLSEVIAITYAAPLFITALSVPLLGEKVGVRRWTAVVVGFLGVLVMIRPGGAFSPASLAVLFSALCFACLVIVTRRMTRTENTVAIVLYFSLAASVAGACAAPWFWVAPTGTAWFYLIAIGLLGGITQLFLAMAIKAAPVSVTAPLDYVSLVLATGLDIAIWGVYPAMTTVIGATIVVATGLFIAYREIDPRTRTRLRAWIAGRRGPV